MATIATSRFDLKILAHSTVAALLTGCRITAAGVALAAIAVSQSLGIPPPCDRTIAEAALRNTFATKVVDPTYPKEAIISKLTGITVAEICVPAGAKVAASIRIVTAPSDAIGRSVKEALTGWRFGPMSAMGDPSHLYSYASKVIYYFVEQDGRWMVLSPTDSFYVGPRFALKQEQLSH
jgi:hypothetical protein